MIRSCSYPRNRRGVFAGLVLAAMAAVPMPMWGQWNGTNPVWTNSNVGIGTPLPAQILHTKVNSGDSIWRMDTASQAAGVLRLMDATGDVSLQTVANWNVVYLKNNGNVGIGTTNPQSKLAVNGNITAIDVMVTNTGWPDYVFQPGYRLRPLREIGAYIQTNHHLPDIPSEAEVKAQGVSLGDMQAKLLAKVEEITLHLIQEHDRNDRLEQRNRALQEQLREVEGRLTRVENPTPRRSKVEEAAQ